MISKLFILFCVLQNACLAQIQRIDTSLDFSIKLIRATNKHNLDTLDFKGQVFIQAGNSTSTCHYSNSSLTIDRKIWTELREGMHSIDSVFLYIEENLNTHSFIKIPFRPSNSECPCLLEIKSFSKEPNIFDCSFWARLGFMGTVYFSKGSRIFYRNQ